MKKLIAAILGAVLCLSCLAGCAKKEENVLTVAASPTPHAEILKVAGEILAEEGITLKVVEYTDYVQPNEVTESGEVDANYFQHLPYLTDFNEKHGTHLVSVAAVHYEPFGLYPGTCSSLDALPDGAQIAVPNDGTNEARALQLLQAQGLITLKPDAGLSATKLDILDNPRHLEIVEAEAAQLPRLLDSVAMAVINGNYALEAGLNVGDDALAAEDAASEANQTFANILVVREGHEKDEKIQKLVEALTSEKVRTFIEETYHGSVRPSF